MAVPITCGRILGATPWRAGSDALGPANEVSQRSGILDESRDRGFSFLRAGLISGPDPFLWRPAVERSATAIAALIIEESDLAESAIDIALTAAYAEGVSAEEWEVRTRKLLGLNPYWHDKEEGGPDARR